MTDMLLWTRVDVIHEVRALRRLLEVDRLCPVLVRIPESHRILLSRENVDTGLFEGLELRFWFERYYQVETEPRFGRFVRG